MTFLSMRGGLPSSTSSGMSTGRFGEERVLDHQLVVGARLAHDRERAALALAEAAEILHAARVDREHVALLRLVGPDLRGVMPGSSLGTLRRSNAAPTPPVCAISGSAFESPPAPTSWIERMGLRSPICQQASITSWQRRCISGLARCTESKSSASVLLPEAMDEAAPPPSPMRKPGPPSWMKSAPAASGFLCVCAAEMLPMPPASMMGLW